MMVGSGQPLLTLVLLVNMIQNDSYVLMIIINKFKDSRRGLNLAHSAIVIDSSGSHFGHESWSRGESSGEVNWLQLVLPKESTMQL